MALLLKTNLWKAGTAPWHCALMASVVSQGRWSGQANCQDHLHHGEAHHGAVHHAQSLRGKLLCFLGIALLTISWNASRALLFLFWIDTTPPGNVPLLNLMNFFWFVSLHLFQVPPAEVGPHMAMDPQGVMRKGHMDMEGQVINTIGLLW